MLWFKGWCYDFKGLWDKIHISSTPQPTQQSTPEISLMTTLKLKICTAATEGRIVP